MPWNPFELGIWYTLALSALSIISYWNTVYIRWLPGLFCIETGNFSSIFTCSLWQCRLIIASKFDWNNLFSGRKGYQSYEWKSVSMNDVDWFYYPEIGPKSTIHKHPQKSFLQILHEMPFHLFLCPNLIFYSWNYSFFSTLINKEAINFDYRQ